MTDLFIVVSMKSWVAEDFMPGLNQRTMIKDWGWEIPAAVLDAQSVSWWMPAEHAARVQRAGFAKNLSAPGPNWLTTLDESLTGRSVFASTLVDFKKQPISQHVFIKPAEAKIDGFEAAWRSVSETLELCDSLNLPEDSFLQWTDTLMDVNHEYRFYVLDGKVKTGSQYLTDGITFYDGALDLKRSQAFEFAQHAADSIVDQPDAYTLDVGWNNLTSSWVVIEGNPAWCSGLYGCDPEAAIEVIERSCSALPNDNFLWQPDAFLKSKAERKVLLQVR